MYVCLSACLSLLINDMYVTNYYCMYIYIYMYAYTNNIYIVYTYCVYIYICMYVYIYISYPACGQGPNFLGQTLHPLPHSQPAHLLKKNISVHESG